MDVAEAADERSAPSQAHPHWAHCHYKQFNLELQLIVTSTEELLFFHMAKLPARGRTSSS